MGNKKKKINKLIAMKKFIVKLKIEQLGIITKEVFAVSDTEMLNIVNKICKIMFDEFGVNIDLESYEVAMYLNDV